MQGLNKYKFRTNVVLCSFAIVAGQTIAQVADQPPRWCEGDEWMLKGVDFGKAVTQTHQVVEVSSKGYQIDFKRVLQGQDEPATRRDLRDLQLNRQSIGIQAITPDNQELAFPLHVGKQWEVKHTVAPHPKSENPVQQVRAGQAQVLANEQLRLPAGQFDTFKIKQQGTIIQGRARVSFQWTYWYAPAAKTIVKSQWYAQLNGQSHDAVEVELSSMRIKSCPL